MNRRTAVLAVLGLLLLVLVAGCQQQSLGKPEILSVSHSWGEIDRSSSEIVTSVEVHNPNPVPIPLKDVRTELYLGDIKMGEGSAETTEIEASGTSVLKLSTELNNSKVPEWWVTHVRNGESSTVRLEGDLVFDLLVTEYLYPIDVTEELETDVLSALTTDKDRRVDVGPVSLTVKSLEPRWGEVTNVTTGMVIEARIRNRGSSSIPVSSYEYEISMNGVKIAEGSDEISSTIGPETTTTLTLETELNNRKLDDWWVTHVRNGETTRVEVRVQPMVEVSRREFRFDVANLSSEFETDILP